MDCLNHHERKALQNAVLGGEWEHRAKLGGPKTFATLLERGWIKPFEGHDTFGDRFTITEAGREARKLPPCKRLGPDKRLKAVEPRLRPVRSRLGD